MREDRRYKQCVKELWITVALFVLNVALAVGLTVIYGYGEGSEVQLVSGLPIWFFYGGLVSTVVFIAIAILVVKFFFKEMPLHATDVDREDEQ